MCNPATLLSPDGEENLERNVATQNFVVSLSNLNHWDESIYTNSTGD